MSLHDAQERDLIYGDELTRWDKFFSQLKPEHPLATRLPDESLVRFVGEHKTEGKALDLGCGNGRNSFFLASRGFSVDAIDLSEAAIKKAEACAAAQSFQVNFILDSVFSVDFPDHTFDLVHDSGLLHHIFPHRRAQYIKFVADVLKPGAHFSLVCFNEKMGSTLSDAEIERSRSLEGGISFNREKLEALLGDTFDCISYSNLKNHSHQDSVFGYDFLAGSFWRRKTV